MSFRVRSICLLSFAAFAASAALAATLVGSGRSATEERAVAGFSGIVLSLPARVDVIQGAGEGVRITADDNVLPEIESVVERGILKLRLRHRLDSIRNAKVFVRVSAKRLESLSVAGSGEIHAPALEARRLAVAIAGSGDVRLAGRAEALEVNISGSGSVAASKLDTQRAKVSIAGSGDAVVWARAALAGNVAGSGDIRYYGDPAVEKSIVGSGTVRRVGAAPT
jgi:hypothetical protein